MKRTRERIIIDQEVPLFDLTDDGMIGKIPSYMQLVHFESNLKSVIRDKSVILYREDYARAVPMDIFCDVINNFIGFFNTVTTEIVCDIYNNMIIIDESLYIRFRFKERLKAKENEDIIKNIIIGGRNDKFSYLKELEYIVSDEKINTNQNYFGIFWFDKNDTLTNKNSNNSCSGIPQEIVQEIIKDLKDGKLTQKEISKKYKISTRVITKINKEYNTESNNTTERNHTEGSKSNENADNTNNTKIE